MDTTKVMLMGQAEPQSEPTNTTEQVDGAWAQSLRDVIREVIANLPDHATLGELVAAATSDPRLAPVLEIFTVHELIEAARARPKHQVNGRKPKAGEIQFDDDGNPLMDLGDAGGLVIRRRAEAADGDIRILRLLAERGALREPELAKMATLTAEQVRLLLRQLRAKGLVHVEGSGLKRRLKITRAGGVHLRKQVPS